MFLGPLYSSISSAFPRSLFAFAWIFVSVGGAYSDRTAGGNEGCFEIAVGAVFCVVLGFDTKDETGGGRLMGLAARKGVVCVKDLTCVALLRSSLRSGCEDIVLFFLDPGPRWLLVGVVSTGRYKEWKSSGWKWRWPKIRFSGLLRLRFNLECSPRSSRLPSFTRRSPRNSRPPKHIRLVPTTT